MNLGLCEALAKLNLKPGEIQIVAVNGYDVELRRLTEKRSDFADAMAPDLWLESPRSTSAVTVAETNCIPLLPPPLKLDESDFVPE